MGSPRSAQAVGRGVVCHRRLRRLAPATSRRPACARLPDPDFSPPEPCLRVLTYNVNRACRNPEAVADFLARADAGVICLQETHERWEAILKGRLGGRYRHSVYDHADGAGGIACLSKHEILRTRVPDSPAGRFPALLADIETPLGFVQVLNVHLKAPVSYNGSVTPYAWHKNSAIRGEELAQFLEAADLRKPLLVVGDLKESEEGSAVRRSLDNGFTDALSLYDRRSGTWFWKIAPGIVLENRLDHILLDEHFRCTGARVTRVHASDHMPVLAVLVQAAPCSP